MRTCRVHWGLPEGLQCPVAPHNPRISLPSALSQQAQLTCHDKSETALGRSNRCQSVHRDMHSHVR
jgi:hypothetical protein